MRVDETELSEQAEGLAVGVGGDDVDVVAGQDRLCVLQLSLVAGKRLLESAVEAVKTTGLNSIWTRKCSRQRRVMLPEDA